MIIKFLSFNIQHCLNYVTRIIDIDLMVNTIKQCQAEIIGLNEVYGANTDNLCQAQAIANKLGYNYYFSKATSVNGIPYGNAIISKYKIKSSETIMIPDAINSTNELYETRCVIKSEFEKPHFTVLITHIGLPQGEKINAVDTIANLISSIKTPIVLMGDFNMEPNNQLLKPIFNLLTDTTHDKSLSFPSINPIKKIDYIVVSKEIKIIDASIPNLVASDHLPHIATLDI